MKGGKGGATLPDRGQWPDKLVIPAFVGAALFLIAGFLLAFLWAPPVAGAQVDGVELIAGNMVSNKLLLSQKIFYFHMPVALVSFVALAFAAYYSIRYLITQKQRFDTCAECAMKISLVFIICTMITGEMWTRFEWGVWWVWEPRLTTYLVLMLIVIAYFVVRSAFAANASRRCTFSAAVCLLSFVDVPICYAVTRLIPSSIHPVVLREGGLSGDMALTLCVCLIGFMCLGFVLYRLVFGQTRVSQRTAQLIDQVSKQEEAYE